PIVAADDAADERLIVGNLPVDLRTCGRVDARRGGGMLVHEISLCSFVFGSCNRRRRARRRETRYFLSRRLPRARRRDGRCSSAMSFSLAAALRALSLRT